MLIPLGRIKKIEEYIRNQLQENQMSDQISLAEFTDSFTGEASVKNKK